MLDTLVCHTEGVDLKGSQEEKEIGRRGDREGGKEGEGKDRRRTGEERRKEGGGRERWKQGD